MILKLSKVCHKRVSSYYNQITYSKGERRSRKMSAHVTKYRNIYFSDKYFKRCKRRDPDRTRVRLGMFTTSTVSKTGSSVRHLPIGKRRPIATFTFRALKRRGRCGVRFCNTKEICGP